MDGSVSDHPRPGPLTPTQVMEMISMSDSVILMIPRPRRAINIFQTASTLRIDYSCYYWCYPVVRLNPIVDRTHQLRCYHYHYHYHRSLAPLDRGNRLLVLLQAVVDTVAGVAAAAAAGIAATAADFEKMKNDLPLYANKKKKKRDDKGHHFSSKLLPRPPPVWYPALEPKQPEKNDSNWRNQLHQCPFLDCPESWHFHIEDSFGHMDSA